MSFFRQNKNTSDSGFHNSFEHNEDLTQKHLTKNISCLSSYKNSVSPSTLNSQALIFLTRTYLFRFLEAYCLQVTQTSVTSSETSKKRICEFFSISLLLNFYSNRLANDRIDSALIPNQHSIFYYYSNKNFKNICLMKERRKCIISLGHFTIQL